MTLHLDKRSQDLAARFARLPADRLLPSDELARALGVSLDSVRRWARTEDGPPSVSIENRRMFRAADVAAWLRSRSRRRLGEHDYHRSEHVAPERRQEARA